MTAIKLHAKDLKPGDYLMGSQRTVVSVRHMGDKCSVITEGKHGAMRGEGGASTTMVVERPEVKA